MIRILLTLLFTTVSFVVYSQIKALTQYGDEVILYDDGTWKYSNDSVYFEEELEPLAIPTNSKKFSKPSDSKFELKSKVMNLSFWFDSKQWTSTKKSFNEDAEYQFESKGNDVYALAITEGIEVPVESLRGISIENILTSAEDASIVSEEYRVVNGKTVIASTVNATVSGIKITYLFYYYSNESGSLQFMAYTSQNLFSKRKELMENLLNGLVVNM